MPSRDPVKPGGPREKPREQPREQPREHARKHSGKHAATRASKNALTLAEAEAKAAEAAAELARARAELLKAQQETEPEATDAVEPDTAVGAQGAEAAQPDSPVDESHAEESTQQHSTIARIRRALPWAAATLAVLTIGGLVAADVVMLAHHNSVALRQRQSAEYAAAARQGVVTLMSLNYETVEDNVTAILDNSTGEFKKDFEAHTDDFTKVAHESKTVTTVDAAVAGVESMSDDDAVVLVAVNTKVTNTAGAKEEPRSWRLTVHLAHEGDRIKMSKVDFAT